MWRTGEYRGKEGRTVIRYIAEIQIGFWMSGARARDNLAQDVLLAPASASADGEVGLDRPL